jgi:hypothetical protein
VTSRCAILLLMVVLSTGCGRVKTSDLEGTWRVTDSSRTVLPQTLRAVSSAIILQSDGKFTASDLPNFLAVPPGPETLDSGAGTWTLTTEEGRQVVQLTFRWRDRSKASQLPYGAILEISEGLRHTNLYYFLGDPGEGRMVEFERNK